MRRDIRTFFMGWYWAFYYLCCLRHYRRLFKKIAKEKKWKARLEGVDE